jgi:hypothetical protein
MLASGATDWAAFPGTADSCTFGRVSDLVVEQQTAMCSCNLVACDKDFVAGQCFT